MLNSSRKKINHVNVTSIYKKTSKNVNNNGRNGKNALQKTVSRSSELFIYLKTKEKNGISLFTHIQALLDIFIFQNPIQPVKYFEFYSEKLKKIYYSPQPDPDLDFLNNIEYEICQKISDKYKNSKIKYEENQHLEEKTSFLSYIDENARYEDENEFEADIYNTAESNEVIIQDLTKINYMFNKAGCGLTNYEVNLIEVTMNQMSCLNKFKNIRYWGKILGLKQNYYILECEWKDKELEYKLKILNQIIDNTGLDNNENIYENEVELEEQVESEYGLLKYNEFVVEEHKSWFPQNIFSKFNKYFNNKSVQESEFNCSAPPTQLGTESDNHLSNEMLGFGTNKKSYFVTNNLHDDWIELPLLQSHHVIQARNIKRYFVGDLESHVESYPMFQGLEKHYLRAQIARITAATQISPRNYFILDTNSKSKKWRKLSSYQLKVMSKKWVHDYTEHQSYVSPSVYALLEPINWVHHIPMLSDRGVTKEWTRIFEEDENKDKAGKIFNDNIRTPGAEHSENFIFGQDWFTALSDDAHAGLTLPWKCEMTNPFDHQATYVAIRSLIWPGAFAVTRENILDYTYNGWGLKQNVIDYTPQILDEYKSEHLKDTEETTEMKDPTHSEELSFFSNVQQIKDLKIHMKTGIKPIKIFEGDAEDEEKIINNYTYD